MLRGRNKVWKVRMWDLTPRVDSLNLLTSKHPLHKR